MSTKHYYKKYLTYLQYVELCMLKYVISYVYIVCEFRASKNMVEHIQKNWGNIHRITAMQKNKAYSSAQKNSSSRMNKYMKNWWNSSLKYCLLVYLFYIYCIVYCMQNLIIIYR